MLLINIFIKKQKCTPHTSARAFNILALYLHTFQHTRLKYLHYLSTRVLHTYTISARASYIREQFQHTSKGLAHSLPTELFFRLWPAMAKDGPPCWNYFRLRPAMAKDGPPCWNYFRLRPAMAKDGPPCCNQVRIAPAKGSGHSLSDSDDSRSSQEIKGPK